MLFALRRGALLGLTALLVLALAACGGTPAPVPGGGATATVTNGEVAVIADDLDFDVDTIQAPAGEAFVIRLTNNENVPHNLSVYTEQGGERIALGQIINEGEVDEIEVPALEPGEYFFVCDLHVNEMQGTLVVEG
ncbi:MAG TPA: cupredoxin domain-containing protein [Candidatus Limnocylindrales bacterium]|nr:cupredoxin domain-containing protein [Candidatus Limnocylindrales bacterium]